MQHTLRITTLGGDETKVWDPDDPTQVVEIRQRFDKLIKDQFGIFEVKNGNPKRSKEFDPRKDYVATIPLEGG